jgi:hypothetical protein
MQIFTSKWLYVAVLVSLGAGMGCTASEKAASQQGSVATGCDSARAATIVLDSVKRVTAFPSIVYRFEPDSGGTRIVTYPAPGQRILDGAGVARLDAACRITSLAFTDSA